MQIIIEIGLGVGEERADILDNFARLQARKDREDRVSEVSNLRVFTSSKIISFTRIFHSPREPNLENRLLT